MSVELPQSEPLPPSRAKAAAGTAATLVFLVTCLAGPFGLLPIAGAGWAAVAGIGLPLAWLSRMPTTCWNGGLIWSLAGMQMVALLLGWSVFGGSLLVRALF